MKMDYYLKLEGEDKRPGLQNLDNMFTHSKGSNGFDRIFKDDSFDKLEKHENRQSEWKK